MKEKHGLSKTRLYRIWSNMKGRCYNQNDANYYRYGGRGITICDEWRNSFTTFYNWAMENGYRDDLSIDRKDNNGNYEPSNCRWATTKQQENNRGDFNINISYLGKTQTLMQWSEETGISFNTLRYRIIDCKWPIEEALTIGVGMINKNPNGNPPRATEQELERRRRKYQESHDSRSEYMNKQSRITEKTMDRLKKILNENPGISNRRAAKMAGISESYVRKLKSRKETP